MDVHVYTLEGRDHNAHNPLPDFSTQDYQEALGLAQRHHLRVIDNTYTFEDSEMVDDFTEDAD